MLYQQKENTMFYEFHQNNSGGVFDYNEVTGISTMVIIEAGSIDEAIGIAEDQGLYFNDEWRDCETCGSRWYAPDESVGELTPSLYGKPLEDIRFGRYPNHMKWVDGYEIFVHYKDERGIVGYGRDREGPAVYKGLTSLMGPSKLEP